MLILWILVFVASIFLLLKASDYFTDSAEKIGVFFGIPAFIVGVTIVSVGTSLPELVSSIIAVLQDAPQIVIGNVLGSNIANVFLVLGVSAIIGKRLKITYELIHVDLPLFVGSALLLAVTVWDGNFTLIEALLCLICFVVYIHYTLNTEKSHYDKQIKKEMKGIIKKAKKEIKKVDNNKTISAKTWIILIVSAFFIYLGARYTGESVIKLSQLLNIASATIALSAVAFGTSLPELAVSVTAARKGKVEIAVGNVLGSNIFNALAVMGVPALIGTLVIPAHVISFGLPMMLVATVLYAFMTLGREVTKWEGWVLILFYVFFIGKLFALL